MRIVYHVVLDGSGKVCHTISMIKTKTTTIEYILPTELASGFINNDWSILDYIDDSEYTKCVEQFIQQLEYNGVDIIDVDCEESHFSKYHDLRDYGVLATQCSVYTARG